jgi:hypothetical protein
MQSGAIRSTALKLLERRPNAIVRHRLLRDVLHLPPDDPQRVAARQDMRSHRWVAELADAQAQDGSWGRFHSMDSSRKAHFPTSEAAIFRALALGLDREDPLLGKAAGYIAGVLAGRQAWSDRVERSEGWPLGVEAISAGMLAAIDPQHPALDTPRNYWIGIAAASLQTGAYDPRAEWDAHRARRGRGILYLRSRYVLSLLGSRPDLPPGLSQQILDWLWNEPQGIGYLGADLRHPDPGHIFQWIESLEILTHFAGWQERAGEGLAWLETRRGPDGLWDLGSKVSRSVYFPLSDDWRKPGNRAIDHTTRLLGLLA